MKIQAGFVFSELISAVKLDILNESVITDRVFHLSSPHIVLVTEAGVLFLISLLNIKANPDLKRDM